ncbi:CvpA family protein [Pelotalea chapellei]|uniref:CvpA family protein n=1 Tax=Pelotalea chapellei TaxID=44671 RepID=A0ABS5U6D0_9BACT|nr:CvpA family protein [Pelotalea chapellei]MBT1071230.1 CvpA family protein [Pelotalea chapellei]
MSLPDILILMTLLFFAIKGLTRGLINETASLAALILGGWLAYRYYPAFSIPLRNILHIPAHAAAFLAFMLLLMLTGFIAHVLGNIITTALRVIMLGTLNRVGGLLIGAAEGALLLSMLFCIGTADFMPGIMKQKIHSNQSAAMFAQLGDQMLSVWRGKTGSQP